MSRLADHLGPAEPWVVKRFNWALCKQGPKLQHLSLQTQDQNSHCKHTNAHIQSKKTVITHISYSCILSHFQLSIHENTMEIDG